MNNEFSRGWRPLLASCLGSAAGILSVTFYTQGLFAAPVMAEFGWTRSEFFLGFTILQLAGLITAPLAGSLVDRAGPRLVGIVGLLGHAVIYVALGQNPGSLAVYYLTMALLAFFAAGSLPITWTTVVNGWFCQYRGLAIGLTMAGIGLSATVLPRYAQFLIGTIGWRTAYAGLGLTVLAIALPFVLLYFRAPTTAVLPAPSAGDGAGNSSANRGVNRREAVRGYRFWVLGGALFIITLSIIGLVPNFVPLMLDSGWAVEDAARIAGVLGIAVIAGRLLTGYLLDRFWGPAVAALFLSGPALVMALMAGLPVTPQLALAAALLLGLAAGAELDLMAYLTSRYFGTRHYGAIFGGIYAFFTVGSGLAPLAYARVFDLTGSYRPMLAVAAAAVVVAIGMLLSLGAYPGGTRLPASSSSSNSTSS
ncbi:MAG: MFS transporter [Gammaproteobacteria bacterium]|nr:MFS transporter [Gammaproteobacteria bacterium]